MNDDNPIEFDNGDPVDQDDDPSVPLTDKMDERTDEYYASEERYAIEETGAPWRAQKMRADAEESARLFAESAIPPCTHEWVEGVDEDGKLVEPAYDVCVQCGMHSDDVLPF
jgi:hypothetical protein